MIVQALHRNISQERPDTAILAKTADSEVAFQFKPEINVCQGRYSLVKRFV
jgi:hypothetical protein